MPSRTKKWYASKGVWLGIVTFLMGALPMASAFIEKSDFSASSVILLLVGVLKVAERVLTDGKRVTL